MARVLIVTAKKEGYRRAGLSLGRVAVRVLVKDLDEARIKQLAADNSLSIEEADLSDEELAGDMAAAPDPFGFGLAVDELQAQLDAARLEVKRHEADYAELRDTFDDKVALLGQATSKVTELVGELSAARTQVSELTLDRDKLQLSLRAATDELAALKDQLANAKNNPPEAQGTNGGGDTAAPGAAPPAEDTKSGKGPKSKA